MDGNDQYAGSRDNNGNVPNVKWNNGNFHVNNYNPNNSNENVRARSEVSSQKGFID